MPLARYLDSAAAHPELKREVADFLQGSPAKRIEIDGYAPRVKVERVLTQLFHAHPDLPIEKIRVRGRSGCSDFVGEVVAVEGETEHRFTFEWCCAWKAEQEGWRDYFGFWDQARAAREFGWNCFKVWQRA